MDQIGRQRGQLIVLVRPAKFDCDILAFSEPCCIEAPAKSDHDGRDWPGRCTEESDHWHRWLLRARRERPRGCRAAEQRDEGAPFHLRGHSMTSSARASNLSGIVKPSAFAVLKSSRQLGDELMPFWL